MIIYIYISVCVYEVPFSSHPLLIFVFDLAVFCWWCSFGTSFSSICYVSHVGVKGIGIYFAGIVADTKLLNVDTLRCVGCKMRGSC